MLTARARSVRGPYRDRLRAEIVLAAAAGHPNAAIDRTAEDVHANTVRKWRRRFAAGPAAGLKDAPRSGRPPAFTAADRAEVIALACALPAESGVPLSQVGTAWPWPANCSPVSNIAVTATTISRGWPATPSNPGSTGPGSPSATRSSPPWRPGCCTCTPGPGPASRWAPTTPLSAPMRRPRSRPAAAATPPCRPGKARAMRIEHDYDRGVRWPTWPPGTSTADRSPAGARTPPGSRRSPGWPSR